MTHGAELRVGVVGGGMMGAIHARAWSAAGHRVTAVLDRDPSAAARLAQPSGAVTFLADDVDDVTTFLSKVDVVSVCTPPSAHAAFVERAAAAGVHVLLEKPSARTLSEHDAIDASVRASGRGGLVMVGTTSRFYPESRAAKRRLQEAPSRVLGLRERVRLDHSILPAWYLDPAVAGGGVLLTNGVHAIDRMAWLLDATAVHVTACTVAPELRRETFADVRLTFATPLGEIPAHLQFHWQTGCRGRSDLEIARDRDVVFVDTWNHYRAEGPDPESLEPYPSDASFEQRTEVGIAAEIDALLAAIEGTRPLESSLADHRVALAAIEAAYDLCTVPKPTDTRTGGAP